MLGPVVTPILVLMVARNWRNWRHRRRNVATGPFEFETVTWTRVRLVRFWSMAVRPIESPRPPHLALFIRISGARFKILGRGRAIARRRGDPPASLVCGTFRKGALPCSTVVFDCEFRWMYSMRAEPYQRSSSIYRSVVMPSK